MDALIADAGDPKARRTAENYAGRLADIRPVTTPWSSIRGWLIGFGRSVRDFDPRAAAAIEEYRRVGGDFLRQAALSLVAAAIDGDTGRIDDEYAGLGMQHRRHVVMRLRVVVPEFSLRILRGWQAVDHSKGDRKTKSAGKWEDAIVRWQRWKEQHPQGTDEEFCDDHNKERHLRGKQKLTPAKLRNARSYKRIKQSQ